MKKIFIALFILSSFWGVSQDDEKESEEVKVKSVNLSLQAGFPYLTGGNLEYLLPHTGGRFTITSDFGYVPINISETETTIKYWGVGGNIYFLPKGRGPYLGIDYGQLPISTTRIEDETVNYKATFQTFNSKLGLKLGKTVFARLEVGYSIILYDLEDANEYLYNSYGIRINPTISYLQFLNGKLGLGVSF